MSAAKPVVSLTADVRLTTDEIAKLTPEQAQAVFEGVGKLATAMISKRAEGER